MEDTNENRVAHLGMIQAVITRMARNSFLLKGWAVTLVAALFALASIDTREEFAILALLPVITFWSLDAYFLREERLFRKLYDGIRSAPPGTLGNQAFSMNTSPYEGQVHSWWATVRTPTVVAFHGAVLISVTVGIIVLITQGGEESCQLATAACS